MALSYCSHTYGWNSAMWIACANLRSIKDSSHTHKGLARSVQDVMATVQAMSEPHGAIFGSTHLIGAGNKEFFSDGFEIGPHYVTIKGEKTKTRHRQYR